MCKRNARESARTVKGPIVQHQDLLDLLTLGRSRNVAGKHRNANTFSNGDLNRYFAAQKSAKTII